MTALATLANIIRGLASNPADAASAPAQTPANPVAPAPVPILQPFNPPEQQATAPVTSTVAQKEPQSFLDFLLSGTMPETEAWKQSNQSRELLENTTRVRGNAATGFSTMDTEEYANLSDTQQDALQWNALLKSAVDLDNELLESTRDPVNEDQLTIGGSLFGGPRDVRDSETPGYREAYEAVFGTAQNGVGDRLKYAPNTVALLNQLKVNDSSGGSLDDYLSGKAYTTKADLEGLGQGVQSERLDWLGGLAQSTDALEQVLAQGRVILQDIQVGVPLANASESGRSEFVAGLGSALGTANPDTRLQMTGLDRDIYAGAQGGVDVTSLISPDEVARIAHMNKYLDSFVDAGVTSDVLLNLESMQRAFAAGGDPDINMTDWQQLVERRLGEGDASRAAIEQALTASAGG